MRFFLIIKMVRKKACAGKRKKTHKPETEAVLSLGTN
jgi:hypothetical protein